MYIFLKIQSSTVMFFEENSHRQVVQLKTATQHWRYSWDSDFADNYQVENAVLVCTHAKWTFFTPCKLQFLKNVQRDTSSRSFQNVILLHLVRFFAYNLAMKAHEDTLTGKFLLWHEEAELVEPLHVIWHQRFVDFFWTASYFCFEHYTELLISHGKALF